MKKSRLALCILMISLPLLASQDILYTSLGAKATGMGGASAALGESSEAIFYNWAAPTTFQKPMIKLDQGKALEFPIYSISAQNVSNIEGLRLSYSYFAAGDIERSYLNDRNHPVQLNETFSNSSQLVYASQYWKIGTYSLGARGSFYYEKLDKSTAYSTSLDFAAHKKTTLKNIPFQWGLTASNYLATPLTWSTGHKDTLPKLLTAGLAASITPKWMITADFPVTDYVLQPLRIGTEYWMLGDWHSIPAYALRGGIMGDSLTVGIGIHSSLLFDYAIVFPKETYRSLEHRFSITKSFDTFTATPEPDPVLINKPQDHSATLSFSLSSLALSTQPKLLFSMQSSIDISKDQLFFWCDTLPPDIKTNTEDLTPNLTYKHTLPLTFFGKLDSKKSFIITIDSGPDDTLLVSGYVPINIIPIIDGEKIKTSKDGRFESAKSLQKESPDLSIQLIQK